MKFCENPNCESVATHKRKVSVNQPHDETRQYCDTCDEAYLVGVQHGRHHEAALHGTVPGTDSSQNKPRSRKAA